MHKIGLCTHFSQTDDWAFDFALDLVRRRDWQLTICHWLDSPYLFRRDMVYPTLRQLGEPENITPALLTQFELELRQYFDPRLGDFTNVAFKLCEGLYQVELIRCFRQKLLDLVVIGAMPDEHLEPGEQSLVTFAARLPYPMVIVGPQSPDQFLLNKPTEAWLDDLSLPVGSWQGLSFEPVQ